MPDFRSLRTWPDVVRLPKLNMAVIKPEVEITFERRERWRRDSNFYASPYFRHVRLGYDTVDTTRHCRYQFNDGGHLNGNGHNY